MTSKVPWDEIREPAVDYNVRLVPGSGNIPLYWAKDSEGHCLFIVELEGDNTHLFKENELSLHGIRVDLRLLDATRSQGLVLTLERHMDRDLFLGLCETLIERLRLSAHRTEALALTLAHLRRWKAFLAGKKARVLSPEEIRGLFGELHFLRLLSKRLTPKVAVEAWCGPDGGHQDFIFRNTAVETKTVSGRERSAVRISSEDQLEAACENLFLAVFRLSEMPDSRTAMSLNDVVRLVEGELRDPEALEEFWRRLSACGYADISYYDAPMFVVTAERAFWVKEGFPRLIRSELPAGLAKVNYDLRFEHIEPFRSPLERIWEL